MKWRAYLLAVIALWLGGIAVAAEESGKEVIGEISVRVYFGTNGDPDQAGQRAQPVADAVSERLRGHVRLSYEHYRLLGSDTKPVFRSYENWAQPIAGSQEILCRFEVAGRSESGQVRLDLELWLSQKKVLRSDLMLREEKPVLMRGPEWRGGCLIVAVELAPGGEMSDD